MSTAARYRNFLRLCEQWPVDKTKYGRDLGAYIRQMVSQVFEREDACIDDRTCDRKYKALSTIASDHFLLKYPRVHKGNASGLTQEELKSVLSSDTMKLLQGEDNRNRLMHQFGEKR